MVAGGVLVLLTSEKRISESGGVGLGCGKLPLVELISMLSMKTTLQTSSEGDENEISRNGTTRMLFSSSGLFLVA